MNSQSNTIDASIANGIPRFLFNVFANPKLIRFNLFMLLFCVKNNVHATLTSQRAAKEIKNGNLWIFIDELWIMVETSISMSIQHSRVDI